MSNQRGVWGVQSTPQNKEVGVDLPLRRSHLESLKQTLVDSPLRRSRLESQKQDRSRKRDSVRAGGHVGTESR